MVLYYAHTATNKETKMATTREAIQQCMLAYEVDVTREELFGYVLAVSTEDAATTFEAELCNLLEDGGIIYYSENNTLELGFES